MVGVSRQAVHKWHNTYRPAVPDPWPPTAKGPRLCSPRTRTRTAAPARSGPHGPWPGRPALNPGPDQPPAQRALGNLLRRPVGVRRMLDRLGRSRQVPWSAQLNKSKRRSPRGAPRCGHAPKQDAERSGAWIVFNDGCGASANPPVRRTWGGGGTPCRSSFHASAIIG